MLDYVTSICNSQALDEVWKIHCDAMKSFGFDRLIYGYSRFIRENGLSPREDSLFLTMHDPAYIKRYIEDEMYFDAPMVYWAFQNVGAIGWDWVKNNLDQMNERQLEVVRFNQEMNVTAGYTISFAESSRRSKGSIALTAEAGTDQAQLDEMWREHGEQIIAMNNVAHLKIISLPHDTARSKLSARQREVLEWVGDGKTNQDVATIMGVTPATVEKHLRIAREKLGVDTTAQALLKMSLLNQIYTPKE